tara:strand:- start:134440 stop:135243 length:804 start_codon:yes stop_codon:yes gene_type:complete
MKQTLKTFAIIATAATLAWSCGKDSSPNLFSVNNDIALGQQTDSTIQNTPSEFPILPRAQYASAYDFLEDMRDSILESTDIIYRDRFAWKVTIINDDNVLNAFATPGGYIYIYTGLMKFLEHENELAGVLGHEIAHADRRHSTDQLTRDKGLSFLLQLILGKQSQSELASFATGLVGLKFGRNAEAEADEYSVRYLCPTSYSADGASGFFEKLIANGQAGGTPEFLSTHPDPSNRVEDIKTQKTQLSCTGNKQYSERYQAFLATLPQ